MKVLILSSANPVDIIEMGNFLYKNIDENISDIFSIQTMAFLAERSIGHKYVPAIWSFAKTFKEKRKSVLRYKKDNLICYGNLFKKTDIKFDHIICYEPDAENPVNSFLDKSIELFSQSEDNKIKTLATNDWYTKEDAHFTFSNIHHLQVFLTTLKLTKETTDNGVESETTNSSESDRT